MIIIVSGEPYQAQAYIREVRSKKIKEGYEPYSFDAAENPEIIADKLSHLLRSRGLFRKNKIILVRNAYGKLIKTFGKKYDNEMQEDILVFFAQRKISSPENKNIFMKHFEVPQGQGLQTFIENEFKKKNTTPPYQISRLLASSFFSKEQNMFSLANEIEKISLAPQFAGDLVILWTNKNPFDITDALARRDRAGALKLLERELRSGATPFDIISRILWQLRVLLLVNDYKLQTTNYKLPFHPFVVKKASQALRFFSLSELATYYRQAISLYGEILFSGLPSELLLSRFFWKF